MDFSSSCATVLLRFGWHILDLAHAALVAGLGPLTDLLKLIASAIFVGKPA